MDRSAMSRIAFVGLWILGGACARTDPPDPRPPLEPPVAPVSARVLPGIAGFSASAQQTEAQYVRRTYWRDGDGVTVTLASLPMSDELYRDWVRLSEAGFAQADLGVPPESGNGFYECSAADGARCNLLVQMRCGAHLEIRGEHGVARRADADAVARGLPLHALAAQCTWGS